MGKNLGRNQRMGLYGQENNTRSGEDKPQHHHELHEHTVHGDLWRSEGNGNEIYHQSVSQWKILLRQISLVKL